MTHSGVIGRTPLPAFHAETGTLGTTVGPPPALPTTDPYDATLFSREEGINKHAAASWTDNQSEGGGGVESCL